MLASEALCFEVFGVRAPGTDTFEIAPVGDGDAEAVTNGFESEEAILLLCESEHAVSHGIVAAIAIRAE